MLSCRQVTECSGALLDGNLAFRERWAVRFHLAMCVHCRRFSRHLRLMIESLRRRAGDDDVPPDFVDRVMAALGPEDLKPTPNQL